MMSETQKTEVADELTLALRKPIALGDEKYHVLELREPLVDELEKFHEQLEKKTPIFATKFLISLVSDVPVAAIGRLGARDFKAAEAYLANFF
ncbi:phage tail assembly protein [Chromobacterium sp. CV08]|uniref:phage tail assembly protein n=1 Tax=Chromobacterium sp. CV08 TaxID=3133274 RepID=UPI003DA7EB2B